MILCDKLTTCIVGWNKYPAYHIAGTFFVVNIRFFHQQINFCFLFASSAPFNNTGGHTHFVKFHSLDSFLNKKNEN